MWGGEHTASEASVLTCTEISCEQKVELAACLPPPVWQKLEIGMQTAWEVVLRETTAILYAQSLFRSREVGLDDLQWSLPTLPILWFCNTKSGNFYSASENKQKNEKVRPQGIWENTRKRRPWSKKGRDAHSPEVRDDKIFQCKDLLKHKKILTQQSQDFG